MVGADDSTPPVRRHVEEYLGPVAGIVTAGGAGEDSLKILHVEATPTKPFHVLVTSGMSRRPMAAPPEEARRVELVIGLEEKWALQPEDLADDRNTWPFKLLGVLARMPRAQDAWFGVGHSIPNGDPPKPYISGVDFCGVVLLPPVALPEGFETLTIDGDEARMLAVVPVYLEEMKLKVEQGAQALAERFDRHQVNEILSLDRPKVAGGVFDLL